MRIHLKKSLICFIIFTLSCVMLSYGLSSQPATEKNTSANSAAKDEIVKLYQELIDIRQKAVAQSRYLLELGQGSTSSLAEVEAKAAEARIQLAEFQGKKDIVIQELQKLEQSLTGIKNLLKREVDVGARPQNELVEIDARILETKIRLLKL